MADLEALFSSSWEFLCASCVVGFLKFLMSSLLASGELSERGGRRVETRRGHRWDSQKGTSAGRKIFLLLPLRFETNPEHVWSPGNLI